MSTQYNTYIEQALLAVYRHRHKTPAKLFTRDDLTAWIESNACDANRQAASVLAKLGFIRRKSCPETVDTASQPVPRYTITLRGLEVGKVAFQEAQGQSREAAKRARAAQFAQRLWALLRIRTTLTTQEAVELLVDAGAPVVTTKAKVSACLQSWAKLAPEAVQISKQRIAGHQRFVLVKDLGINPPQAKP